MAQNIYDDEAFFQGYSRFPRSREGLAGAPEWPDMRALLPPVAGLKILDLGCGYGAFSRWAAQHGAEKVVGIDLSEKMLARARELTRDERIVFRRGELEHLSAPEEPFDLVFSSLAFHYVEDFNRLAVALRGQLAPGGTLVFSVEHPLFTAPRHPAWQTDADGETIWPLDDYLLQGRRVTDWITSGVIKFHRTVAGYLNPLIDAGFRIAHVDEWGPDEKQIAAHPEWADERKRPPFMLVAAIAQAENGCGVWQ